jgi:hypothetical protein
MVRSPLQTGRRRAGSSPRPCGSSGWSASPGAVAATAFSSRPQPYRSSGRSGSGHPGDGDLLPSAALQVIRAERTGPSRRRRSPPVRSLTGHPGGAARAIPATAISSRPQPYRSSGRSGSGHPGDGDLPELKRLRPVLRSAIRVSLHAGETRGVAKGGSHGY